MSEAITIEEILREELRQARDYIEELETELSAQGWRDIKDAPKDGTHVDLWCLSDDGWAHRFIGYYWGSGEWINGCTNDPMWSEFWVPTHFMLPPSPPSSDSKEGD